MDSYNGHNLNDEEVDEVSEGIKDFLIKFYDMAVKVIKGEGFNKEEVTSLTKLFGNLFFVYLIQFLPIIMAVAHRIIKIYTEFKKYKEKEKNKRLFDKLSTIKDDEEV